jgi:mono/diheme cytochrome c family protein
MRFKPLTTIAVLVFSFFACQNAAEKKTETQNQQGTELEQKTVTENVNHPGWKVYKKYCQICHQADGAGVPKMHPPLTPGSWVGNDPRELIAIMMKGLSGKIEVKGEEFKNFMPSHAQLTDEEIADVLSYVRSSFGNNFEPVTPDLVKKVRSGK